MTNFVSGGKEHMGSFYKVKIYKDLKAHPDFGYDDISDDPNEDTTRANGNNMVRLEDCMERLGIRRRRKL